MAAHTRPVPTLVLLALLAACGGAQQSSDTRAPAQAAASPALPAGLPPGEVQSTGDPRAALFVAKGCAQCHSISALGVKSPNEIGPDLTFAYGEVQHRFGMKLEEFLPNPTGTMQMVLGQVIKLSPAERDSVLHLLKRIYEEHEEHEEHEHNEERRPS